MFGLVRLLALLVLAFYRYPAIAADTELTLGVLAFRGEQAALQRWPTTASRFLPYAR